MSLEQDRADLISTSYQPDALPRLLQESPVPGFHIIIYRTSPGSTAPADQWISENYGLQRYQQAGVPVEVKNAWETKEGERLEGAPVILMTGSVVDLGRKDEHPWVQTFTNGLLRQAVDRKLPVLAPCFGMAQLAALYAEPGKDPFPKGQRGLGKKEIIFTGNHPLQHGFTRLTGYVHHNGVIPADLLEMNEGDTVVHAVTREPDSSLRPAIVSFGSPGTLGTSFHREILDPQARFLFERTTRRKISELCDGELFSGHRKELEESGLIPPGASVSEIKDYLLTVVLHDASVSHIQRIYTALSGDKTQKDTVGWIDDYVAGTIFHGQKGYDQKASYLFFDNFLRMHIANRLSIEPPLLGIGEAISVRTAQEKERQPLSTHVRQGRYYLSEIMGQSKREQEEMDELYRHGFGDHLPMSREEHKIMAGHGDTIAIRDNSGRLVALRALVYSADDSVPFDRCVRDDDCYQNHTIVHSDVRGNGLVGILTELSCRLAEEKGKQAIITSVSPNNRANLIALTRQGYVVAHFSEGHFGPGEDRYILERSVKGVNIRNDSYYKDFLSSQTLPHGADQEESAGPLRLLEACDTEGSRNLIQAGYVGTRVMGDTVVYEKREFCSLPDRVQQAVFDSPQTDGDTVMHRDALRAEIEAYTAYLPKDTIAHREIELLNKLLAIDVSGPSALADIYQLTYPIEDEAGMAPTVENGLLPALQQADGGRWYAEIQAAGGEPVVLLGCSTEGSLRAVEEMAGEKAVTVLDRSPHALAMLQEKKKPMTTVMDQDVCAADGIPGEYSVAVSDYVHSFIPRKKWNDFLRNIHQSLSPDGYYVGTSYIHDPAQEDAHVAAASSHRRAGSIQHYLSATGIGSETASAVSRLAEYRLNKVFPSKRTRENNFQGIDEVKQYLEEGGFTPLFVDVNDVAYLRGTGLRKSFFIAKKNNNL